MKILILSNGTGGGHNTAAAALKTAFEARGHKVDLMDPFSLKGKVSGKLTSSLINNTYIKSVQKVPKLFALTIGLGELYRELFRNTSVHSPVYYVNFDMHKKLDRLFKKKHYDAVVMTHLYPGEMLAGMRAKGYSTPMTFWISTDYNCIPFTEEADSDYYVTASPELTREYTDWGIPREKICPLGIPVKPDCNEEKTKEQAKKDLGLDPDKKYILIAGGSVGSGKLMEAVTLLAGKFLLNDDVRIVAICGDNKMLYKQMKKLYAGKVIMHRRTTHMADYMRAADIVISKPGGLSSTEAAVIGTPLIFISPIPGGPERPNIRFFCDHGMALYAQKLTRELIPAINELKSADALEEMIRRQHQHVNSHAAEDIVKLVEEKTGNLPKEVSDQ